MMSIARIMQYGLIYLLIGNVVIYSIVYYWWGDWCAISIPLFTIGMICAKYSKNVTTLAKSWKKYILLIVITGFMDGLYWLYGNLYLHALSCYYSVIAIIVLCSNYTFNLDPPSWLGDFSFDIYLTHHKLMLLLKPLNSVIGLHHFIIGTIILSTASYTLRKGFCDLLESIKRNEIQVKI